MKKLGPITIGHAEMLDRNRNFALLALLGRAGLRLLRCAQLSITRLHLASPALQRRAMSC